MPLEQMVEETNLPEENNLPEETGEITENEPQLSIWEEIERITNIKVELDEELPDDVVGYAKREEKVYEKGMQDYYQRLAENHPDIVELLEYKEAGGDVYSLLEKKFSHKVREIQSEKDAIDVISKHLTGQGFDEGDITIFIEKFQDAGKLIEKAQDFSKKAQEAYEKEHQLEIQKQKEYDEFLRQDKVRAATDIKTLVDKGEIDNFIIPREEREDFTKFLLQNIHQLPNGSYILAKPVNFKDMTELLKAEFFAYKKADISKLVQRKITTEMNKKLQRTISNEGTKPNRSKLDELFNR